MSILSDLLQGQPIKTKINEIYEYRLSLENPKSFIQKVREQVQKEAVEAVLACETNAIVAIATGGGKSKIALDLSNHFLSKSPNKEQLLLVPTEKLRDSNWIDEINLWTDGKILSQLDRKCYASASKIVDKHYSLAIFDEGHNLTELSSEVIDQNTFDKIVLLTATVPKEFAKIETLSRNNFKVAYELTLDECVKLGFVASYDITLVSVPVDTTQANVLAGTKQKPFYTTEFKAYSYLSSMVDKYKMLNKPFLKNTFIRKRMQLIYNLKSKESAAKWIVDNLIPKEERALYFCGSISQANNLCEYTYHSKSGDKWYKAFKNKEINRLATVKAVNEGHTFPELNYAMLVQIQSKEKDAVQRIGRVLRQQHGKIFILVAEGTQDEKWAENALKGFDQSKITKVRFPYLQQHGLPNV